MRRVRMEEYETTKKNVRALRNEGMSNQEIAKRLDLSIREVELF